MVRLRPPVEELHMNGITGIALTRIGDPSVIPLWFGEGDRPTPDFICQAAKDALDRGDTFYSYTRGSLPLREALKAYLDRIYELDVNPDRITVPGAAMLAITLACQVTCSDGDHGLIVSPNWPNIDNTFELTGAEISHVRQRYDQGNWHLPVADIIAAVRPNTKAIFVNSPCNPTGWVMPAEDQATLLAYCRENGIYIIADEVYHRHVYDSGEVAPSFATVADEDDPVFVINGFSKAWAMTGWRIGWMLAPARYAKQMAALSECLNTGTTVFAQAGAVAALEHGEGLVAELRAQYAGGRDLVMRKLGADSRLELVAPTGAFYAFPRLPGLRDSTAFAHGLLDEQDDWLLARPSDRATKNTSGFALPSPTTISALPLTESSCTWTVITMNS